MDWVSYTLASPYATLTLHSLLLPLEKRLKATNQVISLLRFFDIQLLKNKLIIGENFSLVNIPVGYW